MFEVLNYTKIEHFSMIFVISLAYTIKLKPMKHMKLKTRPHFNEFEPVNRVVYVLLKLN
jgi:hypothetical protein